LDKQRVVVKGRESQRLRQAKDLMLQTQLISGTRTLRMGEADTISSLIIQEFKAKGRRRRRY